jgi:hypothetical protein
LSSALGCDIVSHMNRRDCLKLLGASAALSGAVAQSGVCAIDVRAAAPVQEDFGGVGFHNFHHLHAADDATRDQVLAKRWRELGASFARVTHYWRGGNFDALAEHALELKRTGTTIYLTTWDPPETQTPGDRAAYAKTVADMLERLVRERGATNVRYYCMTNELSLRGWASMRTDLPLFRDYHQKIHDELKARSLDVGLLATDASPINYWDTIEWAAANMDDITAIYGGHHYINDYGLEDPAFYPWFLEKCRWGAGIAAGKNKKFILGEFGSKQYKGPKVDGRNWDACHYFDTPLEPWVGIQVAEAAIAAMNAGVHALGYWTFADFPDTWSATNANKWGLFKWSGRDHATRPHYHAYGLLSRYFRGPARILRVDTGDPLVRASAASRPEGRISLAVVNRRDRETPIRIRVEGMRGAARLRKYVYDPARPPAVPCGDLQDPAGVVSLRQGALNDALSAGSLTVYTSDFEDGPPARAAGLTAAAAPNSFPSLQWTANPDASLCYYRIYRSPGPDFEPGAANQIGSTVATTFTDETPGRKLTYYYKVRAVDKWGNAGPPSVPARALMA